MAEPAANETSECVKISAVGSALSTRRSGSEQRSALVAPRATTSFRQKLGLFSHVSCEARVPEGHPLRTIRAIAGEILEVLGPQLERISADTVGPAIAPAKLMRSLLLEAFYTIPSEGQLIEQLGYNLLFRWFVGLSIDAPSWDALVFIKNRMRLLASDVAAQFLAAVLSQPRVESLLSNEHFSVDRALIEVWTQPESSTLRERRAEPAKLERGAEGDLYGENGERMPYYPARPRQQGF